MSAKPAKPNVIVFFTDQQRWDAAGVHGNPLDLMPNFDRVAQFGTHAYNAFTCQPVCGPARSCLQTGMYATNTECYTNGIPIRPDDKTLGHCFREAGYHTGYVGKWHLGEGHGGPVDPKYRTGYDYWLASNVLEFTSHPYHTIMYDDDGQPVRLPGYRVDAQTDACIRYIDAHQHEPFFLFTSYIEPHFQNNVDDYPPPDGYRQKYDGRFVPPDLAALGGSTHAHLGGYWGMIKRLDEAFGRLLDALKSLEILDNTIILFTSDHACHFKTRNSEYKRSCHDGSIRIPMALRGPGLDGGGRITEPVSLIDMPPTLLDSAGLDIPEQMEGRSILPLLRGQKDDWRGEAFVQISESQCGRAIRTKRWTYSVYDPDKPGNAPGSNRYVEQFLYDNQSDPHQLVNVIGVEAYREIADHLRTRLVQRMLDAGETEPVIEKAEPRPSGQRQVPQDWELSDNV